MTDIMFYASFTASKVGKTGLTVTVDVHRVTRSSGASSEVVTAAAMAEIGDGVYSYRLASADLTLYDYVAIAKTADTSVDQQHLAALWTNYATGAAVAGDAMTLAADAIDSDTLATSAVTELSAGNWNYTSRTLTSFGTLAADVWNRLTSALTTSGSIGKALADLLAVFNATTRTLTQSAASVTAAVAGSDMAVTRYTTYTTQITGLTIPADWEKIWLTAKPDDAGSDTDAQIQILETNPGAATDGGQYFNRVAATAITRAYASLTVDQPGGTITVLIKPAGTSLLAEGSYKYDLKYLRSDADDTIDQLTGEANFTVTSSYTVAIS